MANSAITRRPGANFCPSSAILPPVSTANFMSADPLALAQKLIAFDTTSRGSNLALIEFARALLEKSGARVRLTYDASRTKANLFATLGPDTNGGYVLSGHTDVVPVDGQNWSS